MELSCAEKRAEADAGRTLGDGRAEGADGVGGWAGEGRQRVRGSLRSWAFSGRPELGLCDLALALENVVLTADHGDFGISFTFILPGAC